MALETAYQSALYQDNVVMPLLILFMTSAPRFPKQYLFSLTENTFLTLS